MQLPVSNQEIVSHVCKQPGATLWLLPTSLGAELRLPVRNHRPLGMRLSIFGLTTGTDYGIHMFSIVGGATTLHQRTKWVQ